MTAAAPAPATERLWPAILVGWTVAACVLVLAGARDIVRLQFPDPDDAMRLLQVRDWLAGQSWWDVAQHRLNHGDFPMHWSRLVDLPLAAALIPLDLFFTPAVSNRIAMTIVPLLTLLCLIALGAILTRRMRDAATAKMAVLLAPLSVPILFQMHPLRIDHHGWQIVLAMVAVTALLSASTRRNGALAGLALATLLTVSLEGVPIAAAIAGVAAGAWACQPERRGATIALVWTLFVAAVVMQVATRGPAMLTAACDAVAPAWLAMLGVAALGVTLAATLQRHGLVVRLTMLGATGVACMATIMLSAPQCLAGPFATLPSIDYRLWYLKILEGRPIWEQSLDWAIMSAALPIVGLVGASLAWRGAQGSARTRWTLLLIISGAAFAISLLVDRAGGTANALALPGAATLLLAMLTHARARRSVAGRTLATITALLVASPGQAASISLMLAATLGPDKAQRAVRNAWTRPPCQDFADLRAIDRLPGRLVFSPIDPTPDLIAMTHYTAVAAGYHRGAEPMARVLTAFTGTAALARQIVLASGADYLVVCPGLHEMNLYRYVAPNGFWARLERGERFDWLVPVPLVGSPALAWRVIDPSHRSSPARLSPLSATPARP